MNREPQQVAAARLEAQVALARLIDTAQRLQARLSPANLAQNVWQGAKEKGADVAENAVDAVRKRPVVATGIVAAIALFFARKPLMGLAGKAADGVKRKTTKTPRARPRNRTKSTEKTE